MASTTEISLLGQKAESIPCLTIPLYDEVILLPNSGVAEVVSYVTPEMIENVPEWFLGNINWRDYRVPLVSFEAISGKEIKPATKSSQIAILNTLNGNPKVPYIGLLTQGIPSLAIIQEQGIQAVTFNESERQSIASMVEIGKVSALIPDIDDIEQRLIRLNN